MTVSPLGAPALRRPCDPAGLPFETTADLTAPKGPLGQERALEAVAFALAMAAPGYNLFCMGPEGTGKRALTGALLAEAARQKPTPDDWVILHDPADPLRPTPLRLPAGRAKGFLAAVDALATDWTAEWSAPAAEDGGAAFADLPDVAPLFARLSQDSATGKIWRAEALVSHAPGAGAPIIREDNPTRAALSGWVEHVAAPGAPVVSLIRPGALQRANGGFLLLDAHKVLTTPGAWEDLKHSLRHGQIRVVTEAERALGAVAAPTPEPSPLPLALKVVLFGEPDLYYDLWDSDPEFAALFKVAADFDDQMKRTPEAVLGLARVLAEGGRAEDLPPLDRGAVARIVDRAVRLAEDTDKLTARMEPLIDLAREAGFFARQDGAGVIGRDHVERALTAQERREGRVRDLLLEEILDGTIRVETTGAVVGQINGLAVLDYGRASFGRPSRITCAVRVGRGEVTDIEREVDLGGPLHSKGVLILSAFLSTRFSVDGLLNLAASLVFEQSYCEVDGDSASSPELYALLSALAEAPIRQSLAVTGSVDQFGNIQPIGGVNEKIEGFFEVCAARGLTGDQGVLIPRANLRNLMLRDEVVEACDTGLFHVYPIATVDEGIAILTGLIPGERGRDGGFPEGSLNRRVARRLESFARRSRETFDGPPRRGRP
ncbi:Lon protease family protein [Rhodospirillum rubrum]|uniref:endopeptidase La n=1 Tax=Rhodospirillum rubrum (strain ATCC 11170 / ATH 1.1.1 / DSM 467 / LMG 4362 / NCIMB 8255 / S1) TaxID=269796 RepID=Q2RNB8_RHORT|nr:Lon protease family protein [Rhodospirillum rubrum]ABC24377.1 ATP-dependent protease-like [Rhodospirillum rubrum ATCC 11170]AEO50128.1 ATP-dependent protease-like protein [Rhodospirillum rubrum F11]MBK5956099.1 ATP-dependent protease [Rhodospirillum rubrum]QXG80301.1 Lon protease family protein [Rhodospirillum rubrum]HAQ00595.1 Lon protease family protein [Rhodospirillum rubrum]